MRIALLHRVGFVRRRLANHLDFGGHCTVAASSVPEILEILRADAFIDLVIADLGFHGRDLLRLPAFTRTLNRLDDEGNARIPTFLGTTDGATSESHEKRAVMQAMAAGFCAVVPVNTGRDDLVKIVRDVTGEAEETASEPPITTECEPVTLPRVTVPRARSGQNVSSIADRLRDLANVLDVIATG